MKSKQSSMELHPLVKKALAKIDFVERYRVLVEKHRKKSDADYYIEQVLPIIRELGYDSKYVKNGSFFKIAEKATSFEFQLNISLEHSCVEIILVVRKNKVLLIGDPWGVLCDLIGNEQKITIPIYSNNEELKEILKEAFGIYEDFKSEVLLTDSFT